VLNQEGRVEPEEYQPEVNLTDPFVEHLASEFWPPEVECTKHTKNNGSKNHVVEVCNHEVSIRDMEV